MDWLWIALIITFFPGLILTSGVSLGAAIIMAGNWVAEGMDFGFDKKNPK